MKRSGAWAILAAAGLAIMFWSYWHGARPRLSTAAPRKALFIGHGSAPDPAISAGAVPLRARVLPTPTAQAAGKLAKGAGELALSELLVDVPDLPNTIPADWLASGRWPAAGSDEVVAGAQTTARPDLLVNGRWFTIVGVLRPEAQLVERCYLLGSNRPTDDLFQPQGEQVRQAYLLTLPRTDADNARMTSIRAAFAAAQFTEVPSTTPIDRAVFYAYLLGLAMLLAGGSALFIRLYRALAQRALPTFIRPPLVELASRRRLLIGVHAAYFGVTLLVAAAVYDMPSLQRTLLVQTQASIASGHGWLGVAGKAYASRSIPAAAGVTFVVNLALGSLASITLPSIVLPGCGALMGLLRAAMWGLLLSPTSAELARPMLPHSITLLIEGEGYILAMFFALLIPIHLADPRYGPKIGRRFLHALLVNASGLIVIAAVLAVAAIYEATEVILMM